MQIHPCATGFASRARARLEEFAFEAGASAAWIEEALALTVGLLTAGREAEYPAAVLVAARRGSAHELVETPLDLAVLLHDAMLAAADGTAALDPMAAPARSMPREVDLTALEPPPAAEDDGDDAGEDGDGEPEEEVGPIEAEAPPADQPEAPRGRGRRR